MTALTVRSASLSKALLAVLAAATMGTATRQSVSGSASPMTVSVPGDHATIQAAIDSAPDRGVVIVAPGTYHENLDFHGRAITVSSARGPAKTIIDGGHAGPVVKFATNEERTSVLRGFTLQHGAEVNHAGSGVLTYFASPTIIDNVIAENEGCDAGGINARFGDPLIEANVIRRNSSICTGGGATAGGISVGGFGAAIIRYNVIQDNVGYNGGGVALNFAVRAHLTGNLISGNVGFAGGGLWMLNASAAEFVDNVVAHNRAVVGGGIYWSLPGSAPFFTNNTIADNDGQFGSGIFAAGFSSAIQLRNNIVLGLTGQVAIYCDGLFSSDPPDLEFNNVFSPGSVPYGGVCHDLTGANGNISLNPIFVNADHGDFRLQAHSPSVDAGTNAAGALPSTDFAGDPRVVTGIRTAQPSSTRAHMSCNGLHRGLFGLAKRPPPSR